MASLARPPLYTALRCRVLSVRPPPPHFTVRALSLSCIRPDPRVSATQPIMSGSRELDELITATYSTADTVPATATLDYTSPLTGQTSSLLPPPSTDYVSPFSSVDIVEFTNLAEPSFRSLGLAHGWPSGWLQTVMEYFHMDLGLPWWQTIVATTVCLRIFVLPVMVLAQRNMANLNNHQPALQKLQIEVQMSTMRHGPTSSQARFANLALNGYMHEHGCHPAKSMWPMFVNGICMTSMFFGLRGMTDLPVASLTSGGTGWVVDLVASDPYFVLPLTAAGTIGLMMYRGADGVNLDTMPPIMKKIMYGLPIVSIPVMIYFPAALGVYWVTNNFISLGQTSVMRIPGVRQYLGIAEVIRWKPEDLPMTTFSAELKKEMEIQEKEKARAAAAVERNKLKVQEHETKIRGSLLEAFNKEDQERLVRNAQKRLGAEREKSQQ